MSKNGTFRYTWEEVETLWQKRCVLLAQELGIPFELILGSRTNVINAIGRKWLENDHSKSSKDDSKKTMSQVLVPTVTKLVTNPINTTAIQLVELSHYLVEAKDQPRLNIAIDMLKNPDQFEAGRFNLAMFYRFSKVGWKNLLLEPDIPRGKGDFIGEYEGAKYLVECSILEEDTTQRKLYDQIDLSLQNAVKDKALEVGIEIEFTNIGNSDTVTETIKSIREARNLFGKGQPPDTSEKSFSSSVAKGRIFKLSDSDKRKVPDMKKWDNVFAVTYGKPLEERNIYTIDLDNQTRTGMIFMKGLSIESKQKSLYERLKNKVETKITQTHGLEKGMKRIFIIMTENKVEDYDWDKIWTYLRPLTNARENLSTIFFVDRRASKVNDLFRYAYPQIHFINNRFNRYELNSLFPKLERLERSDWTKDYGR